MAAVGFVDAMDVAVARAVLPILQDEWLLSDLQLGLLSSAFIFVSVMATVPAGYIADRVRRTRLIGWTLVSWSFLIVLSATAVNYLNLLFARSVMGIGQAVDDPASTSYLGDSYPARMRGRVFAVQQVTLFLGLGAGLAAGGAIAQSLGWRWAFVIVGCPGLLVAFAVFRLREPRRGEGDLPETMTWAEIEALPEKPPNPLTGTEGLSFRQFVRLSLTELSASLRMIFGIRTMRFVLAGVGAMLFTLSGVATWLAIYHERYSDMSLGRATAVTGAMLGVGGIIGTLGGGAFSDRFHHRIRGGRIVIVVGAGVTFAVVFLASLAVGSIGLRLLLQLLGVVAVAAAVPGLRAAMLDVVPAESRGVGASAMALTTAVFGNAAAPLIVGALSTLTGSLVTAFCIVYPPTIVGLLLLLRARHTLEADANAIIEAVMEEQRLLEAERLSIHRDGGSPVSD